MTNSDDMTGEDTDLNGEGKRPTREETIAEIHRIRKEVQVYPALSDLKKTLRLRYQRDLPPF